MTENILVIKLGALGDFIQALGPMRAIRAHHPDSKITLLTTKLFTSIAEKSNYFDNIEIDARPKWFQLPQWFSLKRKLNARNYFRVYDLQNNDRTNFYFNIFKKKPEWVGIAKGASHRNASPERTAGLAFDGHIQTLELAGIKDISIDRLEWMGSDLNQFDLRKPYALIVSGSAPQHPQKRWPHYTPLCEALTAQNIQPVLIGTEAERETLDYIKRKCPSALNLCGKTKIEELPALARDAQFAIGNDTGPMHIIAPTGCKTIVLFSGVSNPKRHAPLGSNVTTIQENHLEKLSVEKVIEMI